jgi:hypothetical protein
MRHRAFVALALSCAVVQALAQPHTEHAGAYVLRSSTAPTASLSAAAARAQGITPSPRRAVLNVVVRREDGRADANVRAQVTATATDPAGVRRSIEMRPAIANDMVSYIGAFDFVPRQVLEFEIVAVPEGAGGKPITLRYRDRM